MMFADEERDIPTAKAHERMEARKWSELKSALSKVGQTEEGRIVLWHIIFDVCKINEDAFGGEETVYRFMGRRSVGLQLLSEIESADIAIHLNMIKDNKYRTESEALILQTMIDEETNRGDING